MKTALWVTALGIAAAILGYMAGMYLACTVFDAGNLCGLVGVFITGPLGLLAGVAAGIYVSRRVTK
jgi:uncharacterized protein YneF (UPF0154 family)